MRCFTRAVLDPEPGAITVLTGANGSGKTTVLEAVAYFGTQRSFRSAPNEALIRNGAERAFVRAELVSPEGSTSVVAELTRAGRARARLNHQAVRSRRDLARAVPVTVFAPGDLALIQGGPQGRRHLLDDALGLLDPTKTALVDEVERILRQRAALLRQAAGRLSGDVAASLAVWDDRLHRAGTRLVEARACLVERLNSWVNTAYQQLTGRPVGGGPVPGGVVETNGALLRYRRSWEGDLAKALEAARADDLRRGVTTVGPHRDELEILLAGREARTQASQGEQRGLALAIRLGVHQLATQRLGEPPLLLLDDVFSELDRRRSRALLEALPAGQALVTSAVGLPQGVRAAAVVEVGTLERTGTTTGGL